MHRGDKLDVRNATELLSFHGLNQIFRAIVGGALLIGSQMAVSTPLLNEPFTGPTLADPTSWVLSKGTGSSAPCLTAASSANAAQPLAVSSIGGCQNPNLDSIGSGALRLTSATAGQSGMLLYNTALPTSGGLDITFSLAQYGGNGADGLSFFVKDGSNSDTNPGIAGGGLGYTLAQNGLGTVTFAGVHAALFGVGFDKWGNFSQHFSDGPTCGASIGPGQVGNTVVVRGPDTSASKNGTDGYCYLAGVSGISYAGGSRAAAARQVRIVVDPSTVSPRKISVYIGATLPGTPTLQVDVPAAFVNATSFKFGFASSTGGFTDNHEVWGTAVASVTALPTITITANNASSGLGSAPGAIGYGTNGPVTFTTNPTCAAYTNSTYVTPVAGATPMGTYVSHCSGGVATGYALSYVDGVFTVTAAAPTTPASIPTLSEWGLILLGLMLAAVAVRKIKN